MLKIYVKKQANYPINVSKIKRFLRAFLKANGLVSPVVVDVSFVGGKKMKLISESFLGEKNKLHNVLSFCESETKGKFVYPRNDILYLGEVIICYPKLLEEAKTENKLIDDKAIELVEHGAMHLLGKHHD